jgi:hypothetical protein
MLVGETPRLAIRPVVHNDGKAMEGILCDPEVMRCSDNGVQAPEFASIWIAKMLCCYPTWGFGMWAIVEKETSEVIGYAGGTPSIGLTWSGDAFYTAPSKLRPNPSAVGSRKAGRRGGNAGRGARSCFRKRSSPWRRGRQRRRA